LSSFDGTFQSGDFQKATDLWQCHPSALSYSPETLPSHSCIPNGPEHEEGDTTKEEGLLPNQGSF